MIFCILYLTSAVADCTLVKVIKGAEFTKLLGVDRFKALSTWDPDIPAFPVKVPPKVGVPLASTVTVISISCLVKLE